MLSAKEVTHMDRNRFIDISGSDEFGHAKANIVLQHNLTYSDGRVVPVQSHTIYQKPIISIARSTIATTLRLFFESNEDVDLNMAWQLLTEWNTPENSPTWTNEEAVSGNYLDENGDTQPIFFHTLDVILVPIGHEEEYQMTGMNPLSFTLCPEDPRNPIPNVLQLTFNNDWFRVFERDGHIAGEKDPEGKEPAAE